MKDVLLWLAALIPIAASLWVAGAALIRHPAAKRKFETMAEIESKFLKSKRERLERGLDPDKAEWFSRAERRASIEAAGLPYWETLSNAAARSYLDEQPLSVAQVRDQWILIGGSTVGVVLLAWSLLI